MYTRLPLPLADHIARVCNLPGLFVGIYGDTTIEYIWVGQIEYAFDFEDGITPSPCIVIKSNKWLRATIGIAFNDRTSAIVEIENWDNNVQMLLDQHADFPDIVTVFDGYSLNLAYFSQKVSRSYHLSNPDSQGAESKKLDEAYRRTVAHIATEIDAGEFIEGSSYDYLQVLAQERSLINNIQSQNSEPKKYFKGFLDPIDFVSLLQYVHPLGLSGLFGQDSAPHDLEYLVLVHEGNGHRHVSDKPYPMLFVKTHRWLRAGYFDKFNHQFRGIHTLNSSIDFKVHIQNLGGWVKSKPDEKRKLYRIHYVEANRQLYGEYDEFDTSSKTLEAWQEIEKLINLLEDSDL